MLIGSVLDGTLTKKIAHYFIRDLHIIYLSQKHFFFFLVYNVFKIADR